MKLLRLSYQDLSSGLSIDSCDFFPDLNLLVGISGAGKTSILKAISNLKRITNGASVNGVKWDVEFLTNDHVRYHWLGEFTSDKTIVSEYIYREDREIIKIENDQTWFNAQKIPKLSPRYSVAQLLIPEADIYPVQAEFNQIDTYFNEYIVQFHQKYNGNSRKTVIKVPSVSSVSSYQIEVKNWQFT
jgi:ABC-type multidrug transport system ATPase subunit